MLELRLAGVHDDGEHLVLESADGSQFRLPIDQNLRTSIAKARRIQPARSRSGSGAFGPRDIQTRFRQGATVEEIVTESGWDAERVRRYEWPIVAERANIITVARKVLISQPDSSRQGENTALSLDEHIHRVAEHFGFSDTAGDWNTYQQESGQWTVSVDFDFSAESKRSLPAGLLFPARWTYNPANQSIYASNEAAYFLMGRTNTVDAPLPGIGSHEEIGKPAVSDSAAASADKPREAGKSASRERKLTDLLERAQPSSEPLSLVSRAEDLPVDRQQFAAARENELSDEDKSAEDTRSATDQKNDEQGSTGSDAREATKTRAGSRAKRTSVPSWDDIIFGNQRK